MNNILNEVIKILREKKEYLYTNFNVSKIGIFGSVAKKEEKKDSDIDLFVDFIKPIGFKFIELIEYLESLLGKKVDLLTKEGINNIRIENVKKDILMSLIYV